MMDLDEGGNSGSIGFAFGIRPQHDPDGVVIGYRVQSHSNGLSDEVILTIVRNWLRSREDSYHQSFLTQI